MMSINSFNSLFAPKRSSELDITFNTLPRSGIIAWVARSRACFAVPPADSPSTINSSVPAIPCLEQSANFAGIRTRLVGVLRAISLTCFVLIRAFARFTTKSSNAFAVFGSDARNISHGSRSAFSVKRATSGLESFSLVWPKNCGVL